MAFIKGVGASVARGVGVAAISMNCLVVTYVSGTFCYPCLRNGQLMKWSALEDDFRTFLLMPGGSESIFQQFTV
jgi:hypothetical protein